MGRFLSTDLLGFDTGDYNLYRYTFNNPVNFTDPSGEFVDTLLDAVFITSDVILIGDDLYKLFTSDECKFKLLQDLGIDVFALGVDVIFAVLPGATGGGPAARATITTQGSGAAVAAIRVVAADEGLLNLLKRGLQGTLKAHQVGRHFWLSKATGGGDGKSIRQQLREAGTHGLPGGHNNTGPYRFRPDLKKGIRFDKSVGGWIDRFGNIWREGPAHGRAFREGFAKEWDVLLSAEGYNHWGRSAKRSADGGWYLNVTPDGHLSH